MALVLADRVQQTGTANTTVSFTLSGSVTGFQSFAVVGNGNTTYYSAVDGSGNWEVGIGTYATGGTLTRTTILSSSNSGSAVTFSGTVSVVLTYPSEKSVNQDASNITNISQLALGTPTQNQQLGQGNASIMKNRIINGQFMISQYNGTSSVSATTSTYFIDRFTFTNSVASKYTAVQSTTAPAGFSTSLLLTSSAATTPASTDYYAIQQRLEGYNIADLNWGTANAKTVTLSFWVNSSVTGTFGLTLRSGDEALNYPSSYTISSANTWQQITITIAGPTTGTFGKTNGLGFEVWFGLGYGSNYTGNSTLNAWGATFQGQPTGATNFVATNGATFYITGVQLEVGSSATGFEYRQYGQELALCQRYYYQNPPMNGVGFGNNVARATAPHPVAMRTSPTITINSSVQWFTGSSNSLATGGQTNYSTTTIAQCDFPTSNAANTGSANMYTVGYGLITVSAEL